MIYKIAICGFNSQKKDDIIRSVSTELDIPYTLHMDSNSGYNVLRTNIIPHNSENGYISGWSYVDFCSYFYKANKGSIINPLVFDLMQKMTEYTHVVFIDDSDSTDDVTSLINIYRGILLNYLHAYIPYCRVRFIDDTDTSVSTIISFLKKGKNAQFR